ncbi:DinB family protein [Xylanimonas protaetiae]|uniref:DinB family protein n=1 Tax=Xylanimonas protaetiae TaxID=2509457 RepID=A0A4P6F7R2_9MICO|nr:DinB family protein [Xylanimonas protaetiae]
MLTQWLDWQRATVRAKCTGLDEASARRALVVTSPSLTIAGVVAHLTNVEHHWLVRSFLGEAAAPDPTPDWQPTDIALPDLLDAYDRQCEISRAVADAHELDALERSAPPGLPLVTLRWILGHLVHETARHLGHLDLLRELTDGERGY